MRSQKFEGKSVRVKYDPEDLGIAWTYLDGQWIQCRPSRTLNLDGRTEKELKIASLEARRSSQQLGRRQSSSNSRLAEFLKTSHENKALQLQQAKDRALRNAATQIKTTEKTIKINIPNDIDSETTALTPPLAPPICPNADYGDF
jgi:putative transposase